MLNAPEVRVLGALIEKELTTPDNYPLSLNALATACNQSTNRHPVTHFDESEVADAAESLRDKGYVHRVDRGDSRVIKYRHVVYEALNLPRAAVSALAVLMLRGPQTAAEVRTRTGRLYDFSGIEEVEITLDALMTRTPALAVRLPRQPGQKEVRYVHLLGGEPLVEETSGTPAGPAATAPDDRIARLEQEVEELKRQFAEFRKQFE